MERREIRDLGARAATLGVFLSVLGALRFALEFEVWGGEALLESDGLVSSLRRRRRPRRRKLSVRPYFKTPAAVL